MAKKGNDKKETEKVKVVKEVTTTTTDQSREVTEYIVQPTTSTQSLGTFITDVTMNPYMKSREVAFYATGMKPSTDMFMFFDGVHVSAHCAPGVLSGVASPENGKESNMVNRTGEYGAQIKSSAEGIVAGMFKIPEAMFRTGDRTFEITNVNDLVTGSSARTTTATTVYTASSITITKQSQTLTTISPSISTNVYTENRTLTDRTVDKNVVTRPKPDPKPKPNEPHVVTWPHDTTPGQDPIAQSVYIAAPNDATGMFIDAVGIFFKSKDPVLGVNVHLCEMNYGSPDASRILASKYLGPSEISVSDDASAETIFNFDGLAFCDADNYYAFFVQPDGGSPEYNLWVSELGGVDVVTGRQIFTNPYVGNMFTSANRNSWTTLQTEDIKFNLYRCRFTATTGTASFYNEDDELFSVNGFTMANSEFAIEPGDVVYTLDANNALQTSNTSPMAYVQDVDMATSTLMVDSSTGNFVANTIIQIHRPFLNGQTDLNTNTQIAQATITSIDNVTYSAVVPRFASITPGNTDLAYTYRGMSNTYSIDASPISVVPETETEQTDIDRIIASRSNEVTYNAGVKSAKYEITFGTSSDYVSPVINLSRKSSLFIENLINNDATGEETRYGNSQARYISKVIELDEGQDCEDISVLLTAYRPFGTDVRMYIKAQNGTDFTPFDNLTWTEMTMTRGALVYSSTADNDDFREYEFGFPAAVPAGNPTAVYRNPGNDSIVQYSDSTGAIYIGVKRYALKIVLLAERKSLVPKMKDVRSIATQV